MSYAAFAQTAGTLALLALVLGGAALLAWGLPQARSSMKDRLRGGARLVLTVAGGTATLAMAGSLAFSEVYGLVPCSLCWYQRIAMYPLVPLLGVAALRADAGAWRYALPISLSGLAIAAYHVVIQLRPALQVGTCSVGTPCTARYVAVYGFISIPVMAGSAFLLITALLLWTRTLEPSASRPEA
jgi:disulfide bond formation protein DsbB